MANPFARPVMAGSSNGGGPAISTTAYPTGGVSVGGASLSGAKSEIRAGMSGRISLAMLDFIILMMVLFYIWTRNAQGGS